MRKSIYISMIILVGGLAMNFTVDKKDIHNLLENLKDKDSVTISIQRVQEPTNIDEFDIIKINRKGDVYQIYCDALEYNHQPLTKEFSRRQYEEFIGQINKKDYSLTYDKYQFYFSKRKKVMRLNTNIDRKQVLLDYFCKQP